MWLAIFENGEHLLISAETVYDIASCESIESDDIISLTKLNSEYFDVDIEI